ncbi:hypothetical protein MASR1M12_22670 [Erysipelotrichia bacterium]
MTVTVYIPAYNEEKNLENAVAGALDAVKSHADDYEIIILDACSSDRTAEIAKKVAENHSNIRVIHPGRWAGMGANFMVAARQAKMEYFVMFPGDNENSSESLAHAIALAGKADVITSYTLNSEVRSLHRRMISSAFVAVMNSLFGLKLKYYNGNAVYKTRDLKKLEVKSEDFAYNAEILVKLIKSGHSYYEHGTLIKPTTKTAIFGINNIFGVLMTVCSLFYDVRIKNRRRYRNMGEAVL